MGASARLGFAGVPLFPNTPEGQAERLAYYEARKLNHLPHSLLDYHDLIFPLITLVGVLISGYVFFRRATSEAAERASEVWERTSK